MRITVKDVRLAFPNLWKATAPAGGGEAAFSASFILPKSHKQIAEIKKAIADVAQAKWGAKTPTVLKALEANDKTCLKDGDSKSEYDGFEGNLFITSRSKIRPTVVDQQRNDLTEADGKPYAGCIVDVKLELWAQDNQFGKRVNAQLRGVQFRADCDRFGGGGSAADAEEFDEISAAGADSSDDDLTK